MKLRLRGRARSAVVPHRRSVHRVESLELYVDAAALKEVCASLVCLTSSRRRTTRPTAGCSARGPGLDAGLHLLSEVRRQVGVPVLTDVHAEEDIAAAGVSRRCAADAGLSLLATDFIHAVAACGKPVNIKKADSWRRATCSMSSPRPGSQWAPTT